MSGGAYDILGVSSDATDANIIRGIEESSIPELSNE